MFSKLVNYIIVLLLIILGWQCSIALQIPTVADAEKTGITLDTLIKGRDMYIRKCGACHSLYLPEKFTAEQWNKSMDRMQKPAKINNNEKDLILKYLLSKSKMVELSKN